MPLSFTKITGGSAWRGCTWTVRDEDELARMISGVAMGQARVVERILAETGCTASVCTAAGRQGARNLLTAEHGHNVAHRDGWIFQVISWIASHLQAREASDKTFIRPPQMIHAEKGQDGLIIEHSNDDIARVVICEDKATKSPRKQIRDAVLPDFEHYETGARDNELIAAVTSVLGQNDIKNVDAIVEGILWNQQRAYRVAATVGLNDAKPSRLFKGYEKSVCGDVSRRRVELMPLAELRPWMNKIANKALYYVEQNV